MMMFSGFNQTTIRKGTPFKEELKNSLQRKLVSLADYPTCITSELKHEINELQNEFLELRQEKKFTIDRGVEMEKEIDRIYNDLEKACAIKPVVEDEEEDRKRKPTSSKSKRKVCKCKKR